MNWYQYIVSSQFIEDTWLLQSAYFLLEVVVPIAVDRQLVKLASQQLV